MLNSAEKFINTNDQTLYRTGIYIFTHQLGSEYWCPKHGLKKLKSSTSCTRRGQSSSVLFSQRHNSLCLTPIRRSWRQPWRHSSWVQFFYVASGRAAWIGLQFSMCADWKSQRGMMKAHSHCGRSCTAPLREGSAQRRSQTGGKCFVKLATHYGGIARGNTSDCLRQCPRHCRGHCIGEDNVVKETF
jgi:hypothetical protein